MPQQKVSYRRRGRQGRRALAGDGEHHHDDIAEFFDGDVAFSYVHVVEHDLHPPGVHGQRGGLEVLISSLDLHAPAVSAGCSTGIRVLTPSPPAGDHHSPTAARTPMDKGIVLTGAGDPLKGHDEHRSRRS